MMLYNRYYMGVLILCVVLAGCSYSEQSAESCRTYDQFKNMQFRILVSSSDIVPIFPKTKQEVEDYTRWVIEHAQYELKSFFAQEESKRTFLSTVLAFDCLTSRFSGVMKAMHVYASVSPEDEVRTVCQEAVERLSKESVNLFHTREIYKVFLAYENGQRKNEQLTDDEAYIFNEYMKDFKRDGFHLSEDVFEQVKEIKKKISEHMLKFYKNISQDDSCIVVEEKSLDGLREEFISGLVRTDDGMIRLGCDYPTFLEIIGHCKNGDVRRELYRCFNNRAYPENFEELNHMINLRDELASLLGYDSFAALNIEEAMAKSVDRVQDFLLELIEKAQNKEDQEFAQLTQKLPEGVELTEDGKMYPWDRGYVSKIYKKEHYNLDEHEIAEYFPVEKVLQGVFDIYQGFFSLKFKLIEPEWKWHEDVKMIQVNEKESGDLRGYIYLDLYPRKNKFSHPCHINIVPTTWDINQKTKEKRRRPSLSCVIANFPKPTKERPSLLKFSDAKTFLHEFGHAMHGLLGTAIAPSVSGTSVKIDFVEVPSQMFEEWMYEPSVLKSLSSHYRTGDLLPERLINTIIELKSFDKGNFIVKQAAHAAFALELYKSGKNKDIEALSKHIYTSCITNSVIDEGNDHHAAGFMHLAGYASRYYSYLWSKVFALDLFDAVKNAGVLDPVVGKRLVDCVLSRGGSAEPEELLEQFLGRPSNMDAFFKDMGLKA